jgi:hypothetical protein
VNIVVVAVLVLLLGPTLHTLVENLRLGHENGLALNLCWLYVSVSARANFPKLDDFVICT